MLSTAYERYLKKISELDADALAGALRAAINVANLNREAPDKDIPRGDLDLESMPCRIEDNCKSDMMMPDRDYEGRGMLLQLWRAIKGDNSI